MKLTTQAFVEHQTSGAQGAGLEPVADLVMVAPGACTTCFGSTCCSCSCSGAAASA
jgi:hypothetical protein